MSYLKILTVSAFALFAFISVETNSQELSEPATSNVETQEPGSSPTSHFADPGAPPQQDGTGHSAPTSDSVSRPTGQSHDAAVRPLLEDTSSNAPTLPVGADPNATPAAVRVGMSDKATLPHDLSPWNMFLSADIIVQAVMVGLIIASIITWTVWLAKTLELWVAGRRLRRGLNYLREEASLSMATRDNEKGVIATFLTAANAELRLSANLTDKSGIKERVASRLDDLQVIITRRVKTGTGLLATIGATAPFVGLFGTVWGIMNSFIGISKSQTTNLAVVAPGIAEALLATALGLVAAIPAVIIFNHFSRSIAGYRALVAEAAAEVMRQLSRDLDRQAPARKAPTAMAAE